MSPPGHSLAPPPKNVATDPELQPLLAAEHSTPVSQPVNGKQSTATQQSVNGKQPPHAEIGWMRLPTTTPADCPPGLECLASLDKLLIHQLFEIKEAITSFETANEFTVKNNLGEEVFQTLEKSECCDRNCFGSGRDFEMAILDNCEKEVIRLQRPSVQKVAVYAPPGSLVGTVQQNKSVQKNPSFDIKNSSGDTVLSIEGPPLPWQSDDEVEFNVLNTDGLVVGKIIRQGSSSDELEKLKHFLADADDFNISFPMDLDVRMKAAMLGACILIDYMFFERSYHNNSVFTRILVAIFGRYIMRYISTYISRLTSKSKTGMKKK